MSLTLKLNFFLIAFLFQIHCLHAQENIIKGRVTNGLDAPVKFATISYFGKNIGTYSDTFGLFSLKKYDFDSLIITHVGYKKISIAVNVLNANSCNDIILEPKTQKLAEVVVIGDNINEKLRKKICYENGNVSSNKGNPMYYGLMNAIYFSNINKPSKIEKVFLFIQESCPGNNQLRLRFFTVDSITQKPDYEFVHNDIVISQIKRKSWLKINLKKYRIVPPSNSFFIVLESLSDGNDCFNNHSKKDSLGSYNFSVASVESKAVGYRRFFNSKWKSQSEEIGDKTIAKNRAISYHQKHKEKILKNITNKKEKEDIIAYLDQLLQQKLDRIDDKWNFVPYIKIDTKTTVD